jgi:hypothetical protein
MALIPQLQFWHLHWLLSVESLGDLHSGVPYGSYISIWMSSSRITSTYSYAAIAAQLLLVLRVKSAHSICHMHIQDNVIASGLCRALRISSTPNSVLCILVTTLLRSMTLHLMVTYVSKTWCLKTYIV